jgi:biopolymer transport protein ExbD
VVVSKTAIRLDGEPLLVQLPADRTHGVDAKYKSGQGALLVGPLADALRTKKASEVALVFDATTPYRLVTEVMYTAGQSELATFHLVVSRNGALADLRTTPPRAGRPGAPLDPARQLSFLVLLVGEGITLKTRGGNIAPGCKELGTGIAVPKKSGAYDFDPLRACATLLRESNPESDEDHGVTLSANPDIAFGDIVQAIDRVRAGNDGQPLFPDLVFGIAR